jgi:hypothetical protein
LYGLLGSSSEADGAAAGATELAGAAVAGAVSTGATALEALEALVVGAVSRVGAALCAGIGSAAGRSTEDVGTAPPACWPGSVLALPGSRGSLRGPAGSARAGSGSGASDSTPMSDAIIGAMNRGHS